MSFRETINFTKENYPKGIKDALNKEFSNANELKRYIDNEGLENLSRYLLKSFDKHLSGQEFKIFCKFVEKAVEEFGQEEVQEENGDNNKKSFFTGGKMTKEEMIKDAAEQLRKEEERGDVNPEEL